MSEIEQSLKFVDLLQLFRTVGKEKIPSWATEEGYNPDHDRQVAIFGTKERLTEFQNKHILDKDKYPIHNSKMGLHIDIYGKEAISSLAPKSDIIDTSTYIKNIAHKKAPDKVY